MRVTRGGILMLAVAVLWREAPGQPAASPAAGGAAAPIVAATNSMEVLDDQRPLQIGDRLSYRVVQERRAPVTLLVADSGEIEVPLIGRIRAAGSTCRDLARRIKAALDRDYFYNATVIIGLDVAGQRSPGKVFVTGQVKNQGPVEIPPGEHFTVSKAVLAAGGLADFANKRKVRLTRRKNGSSETIVVDLVEIIDRGKSANDPVVQPDDTIFVPEKWVNF